MNREYVTWTAYDLEREDKLIRRALVVFLPLITAEIMMIVLLAALAGW